MNSTLFISIEETGSSPLVADKVEAILSFHRPEASKHNSTPVQASSTQTFSVPNAIEEIQWYFEKYSDEPFSKIRAESARACINSQASLLFEELHLDDASFSMQGFTHIVLEIIDGPNLSKITWEALESPELWKDSIQVTVCRVVVGDKAQLQRAPTFSNSPRCTNVLLVVARKLRDPIDPRIIAGPLVQRLNQDRSGSVSVDIVRPGTIEAFLKCLQKKDYDVVHLDVHGTVEYGQYVP
jgi:hypothetical protein